MKPQGRTRRDAHPLPASWQVKSRGVNRELCDTVVEQLTGAAVELNAVHVKVPTCTSRNYAM